MAFYYQKRRETEGELANSHSFSSSMMHGQKPLKTQQSRTHHRNISLEQEYHVNPTSESIPLSDVKQSNSSLVRHYHQSQIESHYSKSGQQANVFHSSQPYKYQMGAQSYNSVQQSTNYPSKLFGTATPEIYVDKRQQQQEKEELAKLKEILQSKRSSQNGSIDKKSRLSSYMRDKKSKIQVID